MSRCHRGPNNPAWKGGRSSHHSGYMKLWKPEHPDANKRGYVLEHRYIAAIKIGRAVKKSEHVHHVNGDRSDNRPENLEVLTESEHHRLHAGWEKRNGKWYKPCSMCKKLYRACFKNFSTRGSKWWLFASKCRKCDNLRRRKNFRGIQ